MLQQAPYGEQLVRRGIGCYWFIHRAYPEKLLRMPGKVPSVVTVSIPFRASYGGFKAILWCMRKSRYRGCIGWEFRNQRATGADFFHQRTVALGGDLIEARGQPCQRALPASSLAAWATV